MVTVHLVWVNLEVKKFPFARRWVVDEFVSLGADAVMGQNSVTYRRLKPTACPCADEHRASALMGACLPSAVSQRPPPNSAGGWVTVMSGRPRPAHRPSQKAQTA
jgi:hypothetical protein